MKYSIWPAADGRGAWMAGTFIPSRQRWPSIRLAVDHARFKIRGEDRRSMIEVLDSDGIQAEVMEFLPQ